MDANAINRVAYDFEPDIALDGASAKPTCALDGAQPADAGFHVVNMQCTDVDSNTKVTDTFLVVQFMPFGPDGTTHPVADSSHTLARLWMF